MPRSSTDAERRPFEARERRTDADATRPPRSDGGDPSSSAVGHDLANDRSIGSQDPHVMPQAGGHFD